ALHRHPRMGGEGMPAHTNMMLGRKTDVAQEDKQAQRARQTIIQTWPGQKHLLGPAEAPECLLDPRREVCRVDRVLASVLCGVVISCGKTAIPQLAGDDKQGVPGAYPERAR